MLSSGINRHLKPFSQEPPSWINTLKRQAERWGEDYPLIQRVIIYRTTTKELEYLLAVEINGLPENFQEQREAIKADEELCRTFESFQPEDTPNMLDADIAEHLNVNSLLISYPCSAGEEIIDVRENEAWLLFERKVFVVPEPQAEPDIKAIHHQEISALHRKKREAAQQAKLQSMIPLLKRRWKPDSNTSIWDTAENVVNEKIKPSNEKQKEKWTRNLCIVFLESRLTEAREIAVREWEDGDNLNHIQMRDYLVETLFSDLVTRDCGVVREELGSQLRAVANTLYPNRLFGARGVRKDV